MACTTCGKRLEEKMKEVKSNYINKINIKDKNPESNVANAFVLSNYNRDESLKCHLEILKYYPEKVKIIVVHMGKTPIQLENCILLNLPDSGFKIGPLVALMKGIEIAWEHGVSKICYRPSDDWVFNHKRVQENFARKAIFQGFNWFTTNTMDDFSLTDCYLNIERFIKTYEEYANWALFYERDLACERKLARWVKLTLTSQEDFHRLENRERTPPIGYKKEEIDLGFQVVGQPRPSNYNDDHNNRFFNEAWQLVGDHNEQDRASNYTKIRKSIPYVAGLEKEPNFQKWLKSRSILKNDSRKLLL
jgi:hypothetical protein